MQITARILRNWADEGGIPDLTLAELDYRLVHALHAICTDPFLRPSFVRNVELKIAKRGFHDDVRALIRYGTELDWETACRQVLARFEFLGDLDDRDQLFLDLAKFLLGKPYPKAREATLHEIERPLAWLMEGLPTSVEAEAMTREDIKPYRPDAEA